MNSIKDFLLFLRSGWWLAGVIFYPIATCFITILLMALQIRPTPDVIWIVLIIAFIICIILELFIYLVLREE